MKNHSKKKNLLTKVLHTAAKPIVIAENLAPENTNFILQDDILAIYDCAYHLAEFKFKEQHQKYLGLTDAELENLKQNLLVFAVEPEETVEATVGRMVNNKLHSADEIIQKFGLDAVVVSSDKLEAVIKVLRFHPAYTITSLYYLRVRGGRQLLEQVMAQTKSEFKGFVPGQFKFNYAAIKGRQVKIEAEGKRAEFLPDFKGSVHVVDNTLEAYDDYFN